MTHCPPLRSGAQLSVRAPSIESIESSEMASSGPIIQGMGVRSHTHSSAAAQADNRVKKTCGHDTGRQGGRKDTGQREEDAPTAGCA